MRAARHRSHTANPLYSPATAVEVVLDHLCAPFIDLNPRPHKNLSSLLNSVRGLYTHQPSESKRGRPVRYTREELLQSLQFMEPALA